MDQQPIIDDLPDDWMIYHEPNGFALLQTTWGDCMIFPTITAARNWAHSGPTAAEFHADTKGTK